MTKKKTKPAKKTPKKPVSKKTSRKKVAPKKPKKAKTATKSVAKPVLATPPTSRGAIVPGTDPCVCGGAPEDHGRDPEYPSSTACTHCKDCIAYEADPQEDESAEATP